MTMPRTKTQPRLREYLSRKEEEEEIAEMQMRNKQFGSQSFHYSFMVAQTIGREAISFTKMQPLTNPKH